MTKEGWLKFDDLFIPENKIVGVAKEKGRVVIYLQGGHKFSLSKSEGKDFWNELDGGDRSEMIELTDAAGTDDLTT
jgi:hypothetical protein